MLSKGDRGPLCKADIASLAALRSFEYVTAFWLGERAPDLQGSSFEVQVFPFEALQFAPTEPGGNGYDVHSFKPILSRRLEESSDLFKVQRPYLFSAGAWWLHWRSGVAGYQAVHHSLLEGLAKRAVDVEHGSGSEPGIELGTVKPTHVGGSEGLQLLPPNRRYEMHPDYALLPFVSSLAHRVPDAIGKPPDQIVPHGDASSVVGDPSRRVAPRLGELLLDLLILPAVDHLALRTVRSVDGVAGHVAAILALADPVAFSRHLYSSPFISSSGSTPRASASLRSVRGWARRFSFSSLLILSNATPLRSPSSRKLSILRRRSSLSFTPSTSMNRSTITNILPTFS